MFKLTIVLGGIFPSADFVISHCGDNGMVVSTPTKSACRTHKPSQLCYDEMILHTPLVILIYDKEMYLSALPLNHPIRQLAF
jgi:hypothetical protein